MVIGRSGYAAAPVHGAKASAASNARTRMAPSIEADDLHPVRAFAGRVLADRIQRAARRVDGVCGEGLRLLAGDDHESSGGIDLEAARLFLGGGAAKIGELAGRVIDAEGADAVAGALRGVQELSVRGEVQVGGPDVVVGVARGLVGAGSAHGAARHAGDELARSEERRV